MKKVLLLCVFLPLKSFAIECHYDSVEAIQVHKTTVLAYFKKDGVSIWKYIGPHSNAATSSYQSLLQQAIATSTPMVLRYLADDYDCLKTDYNNEPEMLRLYK
ncbi:hypothetical protein [Pseudoalteromonas sp. ASV78]|uniref:hypothetical protein n=1 Tax=Pseudoalteromonas sp. ASV78 TaxID=3397851 RepID=UPI0039FBC4CE